MIEGSEGGEVGGVGTLHYMIMAAIWEGANCTVV